MNEAILRDEQETVQTIEPETPAAHNQLIGAVTYTLIALNVVIFLLMVFSGLSFTSPSAQEVLPWGANFGPLTTGGQWWRMFTACFLHFGILHIGMNMYILFQIGPFTEILYGRARFLFLYLVAGLGGNIVGLYIHPMVVGAGASGAIFGVYGAVLAFLLVRRGVIHAAAATSIAKSAGMFILFNFFYGISSAGTDLTAHIAGLVTGFLAGCAMAWALGATTRPARTTRTGIASIASIAVLVAGFAGLPKSDASQSSFLRLMMTSPHITIGQQDEVFYSGTATRDDANLIGQRLVDVGFFATKSVSVLFDKEKTGSSLSIQLTADESRPATVDNFTSKIVDGKTVVEHHQEPAAPFPWNDPKVIGYMRSIGPRIAAAAGGPPFSIRLLNSKGALRNEVKIDGVDLLVGKNDHITYSGQITLAQAQAAGAILQARGFFKDTDRTVMIDRSANGASVSLVVKDDAWKDPRVAVGMASIFKNIAPAIGGLPIELHLLSNTWAEKAKVVIK